ncbi:hypothetical protein [Desulfoscipio geothermicus]|uniref:hypothetical protein n=1 Tax=Desulfoscipio geothermicus TaxID=39060 RepID=UPI0013F4F789|nr:hypothetical protein [Desulfoscipio geothermicus]
MQVETLRDLEQIPGQAVFKDEDQLEFPVWAQKEYKGVIFFCVTTKEEFAKSA